MSRSQDKLTQLLAPAVEGLGFELVGIEHLPQGKQSLLRVYIDSPEGVTIENCSRVSHQISGVLEVEEPIKGHFSLEVSSPGIDRPLFKREHFERFVGSKVKIKLHHAIEGRRNIVGVLEKLEGEAVYVQVDDTGETCQVQLDDIDKANVIGELKY
jgi:ribosome maturation factor RimP